MQYNKNSQIFASFSNLISDIKIFLKIGCG